MSPKAFIVRFFLPVLSATGCPPTVGHSQPRVIGLENAESKPPLRIRDPILSATSWGESVPARAGCAEPRTLVLMRGMLARPSAHVIGT